MRTEQHAGREVDAAGVMSACVCVCMQAPVEEAPSLYDLDTLMAKGPIVDYVVGLRPAAGVYVLGLVCLMGLIRTCRRENSDVHARRQLPLLAAACYHQLYHHMFESRRRHRIACCLRRHIPITRAWWPVPCSYNDDPVTKHYFKYYKQGDGPLYTVSARTWVLTAAAATADEWRRQHAAAAARMRPLLGLRSCRRGQRRYTVAARADAGYALTG